jgi:predicted PurR-regulated permease PerM
MTDPATTEPEILSASPNRAPPTIQEKISWVVAAVLLGLILYAGLLGTFIAGMVVYTCVHALAQLLPHRIGKGGILARQMALGLLSVIVVGSLVAGGMWITDFLRGNGSGAGLTALLTRMGEIITQLREILPEWATRSLPSSAIAINAWIGEYVTQHANVLQDAGQGFLKGMTHVLLGAVLGGIVAISEEGKTSLAGPLAVAMMDRVRHLLVVFRQVVGAQVKISLLNTFFTAIFLMVVLPLSGNSIPFAKTLVLVTFVAGLIPVLGNLISNTIITVIALSVSIWVAIAALAFLIIIHKVEYFLNARIVGSQIQARAWELLASMLIMEACFGLPGVIAAPIYYAYLKRELRQVGWV